MNNKVHLLHKAALSRNQYRGSNKMKKQNVLQTKEQDTTSKKKLNETEINNLRDKESKVTVIKTIIKLGKKEEHSENFNKR